jgi:glycosyltransferase involved in cell wall biosynthesis
VRTSRDNFHASRLDVAVVMPVFNEAACIVEVIESWFAVLAKERLRFVLLVLNDGSTDATADALRRFHDDNRVQIITKPNSGHGPTIVDGYRRGVAVAEWVFQVDSDGEIPADAFGSLWRERGGRVAVFGIRSHRKESAARWIITRASRLLVRLLFGPGVDDVNVPFRLMRTDVLDSILRQIPGDTFAPNVLIAGAVARDRLDAANVPVPHQGRRTGRESLIRLKLWKGAARSALQTLRFRQSRTGEVGVYGAAAPRA